MSERSVPRVWTALNQALRETASGHILRPSVLLSTDCGTEIDDQWAVIHLLTSPEIETLGFIGNHAPNGTSGTSARDTVLGVIAQLGLGEHPPVLAGADEALVDARTPTHNEGVAFLLEQSRRFSSLHRLNVLVIGAHTDLASAILADPTICERIRIIMMGFTEWPAGGCLWNVCNDAAAARVVFESGVPLVLGSGDVCLRHLAFTTEQCRARLRGTGRVGQWLAQQFADFPARLDRNGESVWAIWDVVVTAYLLGFTLTSEYHRPRIGEDLRFDHGQAAGQMTVIEAIDEEAVWDDFVGKLKRWPGNP
jgi:purine nucleosidase